MKKHKLKIVFGIIILIIVILCLLVVVRKNNKEKQNYDTQVPVLLYHHFLSDEEKALYESTKDYSVKVSTFDKQMKYLYDNGYQSLTPQKMECWKKYECEIPPKSFMITIDDGQKSVLYYAQPILEKYGFTAISFIITSRSKEKIEEWNPKTYQYISKKELKDANSTIYFGSHSHDMHSIVDGEKKMYTMTDVEIFKDVNTSREILDTYYFAYPYNTYNNNFTKALKKAGYTLAFRGQSRKTVQSENSLMISRIFVSDDMDAFYDIFETSKYNQ